jgi:methionine-rich copper-binding protein CopC
LQAGGLIRTVAKAAFIIANPPQLIVTTNAAAADTTPPTVTSKTPAAGATGVAVANNITAQFSEAVNGASTRSLR